MNGIAIGLLAAALAAGPAIAAEKDDVMLPIRQFVDGFNKGDVKSAVAACAEQTSIIDEFPPYEWHGAGGCAAWMRDYDSYATKQGISNGHVTLGSPKHVDIAGDRAYVVIPSSYVFKRDGKMLEEKGSFFTFALRKEAGGWRIASWSWAKD